jgi:hypothetical protein
MSHSTSLPFFEKVSIICKSKMYLKNTNHCFASAIQLCQKTKCLSMNIGKIFTNNLTNETDTIINV